MVKTHAEKIREALTELGSARPPEIMEWIKRHYSDDPVNPRSYRADLIACSINHSSSHFFTSAPKFLWFETETKEYRLAGPEEAVKISSTKTDTEPREETDQMSLQGISVARLSVTGQVQIPEAIRKQLGLKAGDLLAFIINDKGILELRKAKMKIELE